MSEQLEAVRSLRTGAIILLNDGNRRAMLSRSDMVSTTAVRSPEGPWVDANPSMAVGAAAGSGSLARIANSLASLASQRQGLIDAALKLPGGAALLAERGVTTNDQVAPLPADTQEKAPKRRGRPPNPKPDESEGF